jgi:hypothetical protein
VDDERPETEEPETAEAAPVTKETPVTKVSPVVTEAEAEEAAAAASYEPPVADEAEVSLGPLFTLGAVLLIYGLLRRRPLVMAGGIAAVWLDQRSELGRSLKTRVRGAVKAQIKARALG